jgi:hypothetical protein
MVRASAAAARAISYRLSAVAADVHSHGRCGRPHRDRGNVVGHLGGAALQEEVGCVRGADHRPTRQPGGDDSRGRDGLYRIIAVEVLVAVLGAANRQPGRSVITCR